MKEKRQANITPTSTPNFYDVLSSNDYDHYPLEVRGAGLVVCGCPAGEKKRHCYHRDDALDRFPFIPVIDDTMDEFTWQRIKRNIEYEADLDAIRELLNDYDGPEAA